MNSFNKLLRAYCKKAGITKKELAKKMKVSYEYLCIAGSRKGIEYERLIKITKLLKLSEQEKILLIKKAKFSHSRKVFVINHTLLDYVNEYVYSADGAGIAEYAKELLRLAGVKATIKRGK